jgi:hypothetical protein
MDNNQVIFFINQLAATDGGDKNKKGGAILANVPGVNAVGRSP